jgi:hypothetical protein
MHPINHLLPWLGNLDFAVLEHGFLPHGRDYRIVVETCLHSDPGQYELVLTHCVRLDYETRVRDDVWPGSWTAEFLDYEKWQEAGEPEGYVWGTNWSNAYPGLTLVEESPLAKEWTDRIGREFFEWTLETDRFFMRIVFHDVRYQKLSDDTGTISQIIMPL